MAALSLVSLEGNWDPVINAERLELAALAFHQSRADFIISSGTYKPGLSANTGARAKKLGERNTDALRRLHDFDSALIVPAHAFPFEFTYTTIEAFGNACVIGWLLSGFERQTQSVPVDFAPISSGIHRRRVHALNVRACQALEQFNVKTFVKEQALSGTDEPDMIESEAGKLSELMQAGGVIDTGRWRHGAEQWSLDDPRLMREMITGMIRMLLPGAGEDQIQEVANVPTTAQRHSTLQMLCEISANRALSSSALNRIFTRTTQRFTGAFDEASAARIAQTIARAAGEHC